MIDFITYLVKVVAIQGVLFALYQLFFARSARHSLNRIYLLFSLLLAFVIPFLEFSIPASSSISASENPVIFWLSDPAPALQQFEMVPVAPMNDIKWAFLLWSIYGFISMIMLARSVSYLLALQELKKHSEYIKRRWFSLFKTTHDKPFSFFKNIFIPARLFGTDGFDQVLAHECVHVRKRHSMDRLFLDFLVSLFWFNPFIYLYRNALIEIHEYQADEAVIRKFKDPIAYQEVLFSQLQSAEYAGLVSHFNFSMIKKRIVMMNKRKKMSGWVYSLSLPVFLVMAFTFSNKEAMEPIEKVGQELTSLIGPTVDFKRLVDIDFQDRIPSIQPVRNSDLTRLTSGFGMRNHPITKERKMHLGVDFACKLGSEVIATADGTIESLSSNPGGYGKSLVIDHGNGYKTRYAQLSEFKVAEGDIVKKRDVIALSGNSGMSTAPHLHYEVQKGDKRVDPMDYIKDYKAVPVLKKVPSKTNSNEGLLREENVKDPSSEQEAMIAKEKLERARELKLIEQEKQITLKEKEQNAEQLAKEEQERLQMEKQKQAEVEKDLLHQEHIRIRNGGKDPLYILDGKVVENVSDLDPSNINNIRVLKGKKANSKYGKKGKNGVIEINTKSKTKEKENQTGIERNNKQSYRVIIDPGHGGMDPGAKSPSGIKEADIALQVSGLIRDYLEDETIKLIFTRTGDEFVPLSERSALSQDADLFLSIHTDNYEDQDSSFVLPIYYEGNAFSRNSLYFATLLSQEFRKSGQYTQVGSIYECAPQATTKYDLLGKANCPAVLLNVGFFSNRSVEKSLSSEEGQRLVAKHIAEAIRASRL